MKEAIPDWKSGLPSSKRLKGLDLLSFAPMIKRHVEENKFWDPIRKKWLSISPEETVRLSLIYMLKSTYNISFRRMSVERGIIQGHRRYDLLTFNEKGNPHLLVECKSPEIKLRIEHITQLGTYNDQLKASFALLTNGLDAFLINLTTGEFLETLSDCFGTNS